MKFKTIALATLLLTTALVASAENLRIIGEATTFSVQTPNGPIEITRQPVPGVKVTKGGLQPLIPIKGIHPVTEIEILNALNDTDSVVVDMRLPDERAAATIPNSVGIPYTDVTLQLGSLGCMAVGAEWDCTAAKKVYAFCNGPVCMQSPIAMAAMVRVGFPVDKLYYYRGGMLNWTALGLTTVAGEL